MTGNAVYDAVGSITIGMLLGCTAVFLIQQNRSLLLGLAYYNALTSKTLNPFLDSLHATCVVA